MEEESKEPHEVELSPYESELQDCEGALSDDVQIADVWTSDVESGAGNNEPDVDAGEAIVDDIGVVALNASVVCTASRHCVALQSPLSQLNAMQLKATSHCPTSQ